MHVEVIDRVIGSGTGLHLDGDPLTVKADNKIDFAAANSDVAFQDGGAPFLEEPGGDPFA